MKRILGMVLVFGLVAAGCGGDDGVSISDPWARNSPKMASRGAAYMVIEGGTEADRLLSASAPTTISASAEVHENIMKDDGAMAMQELSDGLPIPAGETVTLQPGGYHVMFIDLAQPLEIGQKFTVTLTFEKAGDMDVEVEVREG